MIIIFMTKMMSVATEQMDEHYGRPVMWRKAVRSWWRVIGCRRYNFSLMSSWALSVNRPSTYIIAYCSEKILKN